MRRRSVAKPKPDHPPAAALYALANSEAAGGAGRIAVRVTPGARIERLELAEGKLIAKVRAVPEDGKANVAVAQLLAAALGIATSRLRLLRGATSRDKLFQLDD